MAYIIFNFLTLFFIKIYDYFYKAIYSRCILALPVIFLLALLPALQYGVGTDYFSYERIFNQPSILEHYNRNNELFFYYLVKTIKLFDFDSKGFFSIISIIQATLILYSFNIFKRNNYNLVVLFFLFFTVTNLLHTQMNIIRASFAIYFFVISFLYKIEKNIYFAFLLLFSLFYLIILPMQYCLLYSYLIAGM